MNKVYEDWWTNIFIVGLIVVGVFSVLLLLEVFFASPLESKRAIEALSTRVATLEMESSK